MHYHPTEAKRSGASTQDLRPSGSQRYGESDAVAPTPREPSASSSALADAVFSANRTTGARPLDAGAGPLADVGGIQSRYERIHRVLYRDASTSSRPRRPDSSYSLYHGLYRGRALALPAAGRRCCVTSGAASRRALDDTLPRSAGLAGKNLKSRRDSPPRSFCLGDRNNLDSNRRSPTGSPPLRRAPPGAGSTGAPRVPREITDLAAVTPT